MPAQVGEQRRSRRRRWRCRTGGSRGAGGPSARRGRRTRPRGPSTRAGDGDDGAADAGEPGGQLGVEAVGSAVGGRPAASRRRGRRRTARPPRSPCGNSSPASGRPAWTTPAVMPGSPGASLTGRRSAAGHGLVAGGGLGGVGHADHLAQLDREVDGRAGARSALLVVGGEQVAGAARPSSTRSSFQARLAASRRPEHMPWPANGRHQVGGVAGEQRPADLPALGPRGPGSV